jgi:hypothetical protein
MVSAGDRHTVGLRLDGTVVAVGDNTFNQCDTRDLRSISVVCAGPQITISISSLGLMPCYKYGLRKKQEKYNSVCDWNSENLGPVPKDKLPQMKLEAEQEPGQPELEPEPETSGGGGCYVATCVYGSYDSPEVWALRRYRDNRLSNSWVGRRFIQVYYAISPKIVALFGDKKWFNRFWKPVLNIFVRALQKNGMDCGPYTDV